MLELEINKSLNFIAGWKQSNTEICDEIIDYHINSKNKFDGRMAGFVDKTEKDSIDCILQGNLKNKYHNYVFEVAKKYVELYPYSNYYAHWSIVESIQIQHYKPGGGYFCWHTERDSCLEPYCKRHLVFMTYLNDVTEGGETEWIHQNLKIKPEKGLTVIWPADWTFTHRGLKSQTQDKYIITGWFSYSG